MVQSNQPILAFNRGIISPRALARLDLKRSAFSAETMVNWAPRVLGSMMLRPGWGYTAPTYLNSAAVTIPFVYTLNDTAMLEISNQIFRPIISEQPITRVAVGTTVVNPAFNAYLLNGTFLSGAGWTTGAGWVISGGFATATLSSGALSQSANVALISGQTYSITYTIARSAGSVIVSIGGVNGASRSAAGTYTDTIVAGGTQNITFTGTGFTGTVSAVSMLSTTAGWRNVSDAGGVETQNGLLVVTGTGFAAGAVEQTLTIAGGDQTKEQALRIIVARGKVTLSIGTTTGNDDLIARTELGTGVHSLAFTPGTGNASVYVRLESLDQYQKQVTSVNIEAAGVVTLPAPWVTQDLFNIRWDASADVTYLACYGYQQKKIERRSTTSWSIVDYAPLDGPFQIPNTGPITLTPSAINGDITLASSRPLFYPGHVGGLMKLTSTGQLVTAAITAQNEWSNPIEVTGVGAQRTFFITISNTFSGTVRLQMSVGAPGSWINVSGQSYTTVENNLAYTDGLASQDIFYRIGIATGDYTSGEADVQLSYSAGSIDGIVKITGYNSSQSVNAAVVTSLGSTTPTSTWKMGEWSNEVGWPSEMKLHEGRMFNSGLGKVWGSLPDAYESWDETIIGDGGQINVTFGKGPVDQVQWMISLQRLVLGGQVAEWSARSDSLDNPLTPSNITIRSPSSQGSAPVQACQIDTRAVYVQKSGTRLYELNYASQGGYLFDYQTQTLSDIAPELLLPGIKKVAVQRQPDTRIHCVMNDGTVAILISQPSEEVQCWCLVSTQGFVEDVCVMPARPDGSVLEDAVYYTVNRTVNGATVRYRERWAFETECDGGTLNLQGDSFVTQVSGALQTTITAAHLKGMTGVLWGDGKALGTATADVTTGIVTVPNGASAKNLMFGLGYTADFESSKLAYQGMSRDGTPLTMKKKVDHLGLVLYDTHYQGLQYGPSFSKLNPLPLVYKGQTTPVDTVYTEYDAEPFEFPGVWDTDSRLCLRATAPYPCTVLGAVMGINSSD